MDFVLVLFFIYRCIIKLDKRIGFKVIFMLNYLEFGWLDGFDIYVDES